MNISRKESTKHKDTVMLYTHSLRAPTPTGNGGRPAAIFAVGTKRRKTRSLSRGILTHTKKAALILNHASTDALMKPKQ